MQEEQGSRTIERHHSSNEGGEEKLDTGVRMADLRLREGYVMKMGLKMVCQARIYRVLEGRFILLARAVLLGREVLEILLWNTARLCSPLPPITEFRVAFCFCI